MARQKTDFVDGRPLVGRTRATPQWPQRTRRSAPTAALPLSCEGKGGRGRWTMTRGGRCRPMFSSFGF